MTNRQIPPPPRTVGKFYQTQHPPHPTQHPQNFRKQSARNRSNSVGRIYNTRYSSAKDCPTHQSLVPQLKMSYERSINYHEAENKLSSYLQCTIRTSSRQKYNYLSTHLTQKYESETGNPHCMAPREANKYSHDFLLERVGHANEILKDRIHRNQKPIQIPKQKQLKSSRRKEGRQPIEGGKQPTRQSKQAVREKLSSRDLNKQNIFTYTTSAKKQGTLGIVGLNHEQHKNELESKLKKMINSYQVKNKELEKEMQKIEAKANLEEEKNKKQGEVKQESVIYKDEQLQQTFNKMVAANLKGVNLKVVCDEKLEQIWREIHQQIAADEQVRMIKCFISESNINQIFAAINETRIKKIDMIALQSHPDQYDPFLVEHFHSLLHNNNPILTHPQTCKWICDQFAKYYDLSQKKWLKHFTQQRMECAIRTMSLDKDIKSLRKAEENSKELPIRDFTRYLSILYKANLRNRNVYQIYIKFKGMPYLGRFIQLLQEKAGKGGKMISTQK